MSYASRACRRATTFYRQRMTIVLPRKSVCLALACGATLLAFHAPLARPAQRFVTQAQNTIAGRIAGPQFDGVAANMESYRAVAGSYEGAEIGGQQITMRWTSATAYCVEGVSPDGSVSHLLGPNGQVSPGRCP